jgi:hypothetical protein
MREKDTSAYLVGKGEIKKIGTLYSNEWGE